MGGEGSTSMLSRRRVLRGCAAVGGSAVLSGCRSLGLRTVVTVPATGAVPVSSIPPATVPIVGVTQPVPRGGMMAASMVVQAEMVGELGAGFVGLAFEKSAMAEPLFSAANTGLIALFRLLRPGVLCVGGRSVDESVWVAQGEGQVQGQIAPQDVDGLAGFLAASGWSCIYGVNLGGSANGTTTAALAAAEVSYVAQLLGSRLLGVEIGNECERYGDAGSYYAGNWSVERFEAVWKLYRAAILAETPGVQIMGPAAAGEVDSWVLPFGEYVTASEVQALTQHYARAAATVGSAEDLLARDTVLEGELLTLKEGAQSVGVPFRITRCSAVGGGGMEGVSDAYAAALWSLDVVFGSALGGGEGVNFASGSGEAGAPIMNSGGVLDAVQPGFYGLLLAAMAGQGVMLSAAIEVGLLNVSGYAVQGFDGGISVVIVNKDKQNLQLKLTLPKSVSAATLMMMQDSGGAAGPSLRALSGVTIQGGSVGVDGSFFVGQAYELPVSGMEVSCYVPTLSAVLIQAR